MTQDDLVKELVDDLEKAIERKRLEWMPYLTTIGADDLIDAVVTATAVVARLTKEAAEMVYKEDNNK